MSPSVRICDTPTTRDLYIALATLSVAACAGGEGQWPGTISDSAGVAIVSNPVNGMWTASNRWTLDEELRIGALEGDPDYQFGQIGWIDVGSDGRIFVLDTHAQRVTVYSAQGTYQGSFGGPGAGPGELGQGAAFLLVGRGDTILVTDVANQRVNRYAPDGSGLGSFRLSLENGFPLQFRATASGLLAVQLRPFALLNRGPAPDPMDAIVLLSLDGSVADTVKRFPSGGTVNMGGGSPEIRLYSPEPVWAIADDLGLLFGVNDEYRIRVYAANGGLERIITKPFSRAPINARDREALLRFLERSWTDAGMPPAMLPLLRNTLHFAEFFPAFSAIQTGPAGTIWVQHVQSPADLPDEELEAFNPLEDTGAPNWDVFDSDGRYLGVVSMPPRFTPHAFRGNEIYGVWRDELDVHYVMRLRVVGAPAGQAHDVD